MNRFKFLAFIEEFPFLAECNKRNSGSERDYMNCDKIEVKRVTEELLYYTPRYEGATGSLVGVDDGERFDFIFSNGEIINDAVKSRGYVTHNEAHSDNEEWPGETILEAIDRHQAAKDLVYIVKVQYGYHIPNHYSEPDYSMIIYKTAKNFKLDDIIKGASEKALTEVQAEANF